MDPSLRRINSETALHEQSKLPSDSGKLVLNVHSPPQTFRVQWLGSNKQICEALEANDAVDVDSVTRSISLQTKLMKFVSVHSSSTEIRAFVAVDHKKLELTLGPYNINKYFKSFCEGGPPFVCGDGLDHAWYQLLNSRQPVPILVTRYSSVECAIGYLEIRYSRQSWQWSEPYDVNTMFCKLPAELKSNDRVIEAYVKAGLDVFLDPFPMCATPTVHLAYAKYRGLSTWSRAPKALQQNKSFVLQLTQHLALTRKVYYTNWSLPPHVDDVYSDCLHNCLYRTDHTRAEILARVAVCGDVLALHPSYLNDPEIVLAAFKSNTRYDDFPSCHKSITMPLSMWNNKQVALEVVSHHGNAIRLFSDVLADDFDVGLTAVGQNSDAYRLLSERLRGTTEIVLRAASHGKTLYRVPLKVQTNKNLVLKLVSLNEQAFNGFDRFEAVPNKERLEQLVYNSQRFIHDRKFMIDCVEANWRTALYVPFKMRKSDFGQVVCTAVCKHFNKARLACYHFFLQPFLQPFGVRDFTFNT